MGAKKEGKKKRNTMFAKNTEGFWDGHWYRRVLVKTRARKKFFNRKGIKRNIAG
jgi:hypothetical protein